MKVDTAFRSGVYARHTKEGKQQNGIKCIT
jgi:hypothetical protein